MRYEKFYNFKGGQRYKGGIRDLGNFRDGFCFRLKTKMNAAWDICADSMREKEKWMEAIESVMPKTFGKNDNGED